MTRQQTATETNSYARERQIDAYCGSLEAARDEILNVLAGLLDPSPDPATRRSNETVAREMLEKYRP